MKGEIKSYLDQSVIDSVLLAMELWLLPYYIYIKLFLLLCLSLLILRLFFFDVEKDSVLPMSI